MELPEKQYFNQYSKKKGEAFNAEKTETQKDTNEGNLTKIAFDKKFSFEKNPI